jgi:U3 small nucleolar RNA-associated protein 20
LHVIEDIVGVFDELHIRPFLDLLVGCVVRVLESCTSSLETVKLNGLSSHQHNSSTNSNSLGEERVPENQIPVMVFLHTEWKLCITLCFQTIG